MDNRWIKDPLRSKYANICIVEALKIIKKQIENLGTYFPILFPPFASFMALLLVER